MLNESILEIPYFQLNVDKNKLGILPFWGALELISIFVLTGPNKEKAINLDIMVFLEF